MTGSPTGSGAERVRIDSYGPGRFVVSGVPIEGSVVLFGNQVIPWAVRSIDGIGFEDFAPLLDIAGQAELMLVGCGVRAALLPSDVKRRLRAAGIVTEAMDTGAAVRTFSVLVAENRRVAAALIALPS